jgi:phage shock protein C
MRFAYSNASQRPMAARNKESSMHDTQYAPNEVENSEPGQPERLFGICQAVGDHLGFNPIFLRIGLIGLLFFGPALMFGAYAGLGLIVGVSHLVFPKPQDVEAMVEHAGIVELPAHVEFHSQPERELIAA